MLTNLRRHVNKSSGTHPHSRSSESPYCSGTGPKSFFASNRAKAIMQIISLIRASSSTLFEFSITGNGYVYFDALKLTQMHFPRLRRLTLWSMLGNVADIRKFILVHQANPSGTQSHFLLHTFIPDVVMPFQDYEGAFVRSKGTRQPSPKRKEKIDSLVHPEDVKVGPFRMRCICLCDARGQSPSSFLYHFRKST